MRTHPEHWESQHGMPSFFLFLLLSTFLFQHLLPSPLIFFFLSYPSLQPKSQGTLGSLSPTDCLAWVHGLALVGWRKTRMLCRIVPTLNDFTFFMPDLFSKPNETLRGAAGTVFEMKTN